MLPVGFNFGKKVNCPLCRISEDTDKHLLNCPITKLSCPILIENTQYVFEDIYSTDSIRLANVSKLIESALRTREELLQT